MIVFDLLCETGHRFEAWFQDSGAFERQQAERSIECPVCGEPIVGRAPTAARPARGLTRDLTRRSEAGDSETAPTDAPPTPGSAPGLPEKFQEMLATMREHIEKSCDYVGPSFPEEARKIHYGETERRNIYGEASPSEAAGLADEGIEIQAVPWLHRRDD